MIKLIFQTVAVGAAGMCAALVGGLFAIGGMPLGAAEVSGAYTMIGWLVGGVDWRALYETYRDVYETYVEGASL